MTAREQCRRWVQSDQQRVRGPAPKPMPPTPRAKALPLEAAHRDLLSKRRRALNDTCSLTGSKQQRFQVATQKQVLYQLNPYQQVWAHLRQIWALQASPTSAGRRRPPNILKACQRQSLGTVLAPGCFRSLSRITSRNCNLPSGPFDAGSLGQGQQIRPLTCPLQVAGRCLCLYSLEGISWALLLPIVLPVRACMCVWYNNHPISETVPPA